MARRTRTRAKNPKLVTKKKRKSSYKRYAKKFKATPILKQAIKQILNKDRETHNKEYAIRIGHDVNQQIDGEDINSIFDVANDTDGAVNRST